MTLGAAAGVFVTWCAGCTKTTTGWCEYVCDVVVVGAIVTVSFPVFFLRIVIVVAGFSVGVAGSIITCFGFETFNKCTWRFNTLVLFKTLWWL